MDILDNEIHAGMETHIDTAVCEVTGRLVAAPSMNPGGDERRVATEVGELCEDLGLPAPRQVGRADHPNLVIDLDFGSGGRTLALCGHLDTKPIGDGDWETDPLVATVVGDELRGRGVADMKGALAAMLLAAVDLTTKSPRSGRLSLVFCADEENGATHGAKWLVAHDAVEADAMVIGEPGGIERDWDRLHLGSRGICNFDVELITEQAHSGLRDVLGLPSATEAAARILVELASGFAPSVEGTLLWRPVVNAGVVIEGGTTYGVIPGRARIASDCRLVPGMDQVRFLTEVRELVESVISDGVEFQIELRDWIPPVLMSSDLEIVTAAREALETVIGFVPSTDLFPATTDAIWFSGVGIDTLPALGPGLLRHAHARNERVSITALGQARTLYGRLADLFCGVEA